MKWLNCSAEPPSALAVTEGLNRMNKELTLWHEREVGFWQPGSYLQVTSLVDVACCTQFTFFCSKPPPSVSMLLARHTKRLIPLLSR